MPRLDKITFLFCLPKLQRRCFDQPADLCSFSAFLASWQYAFDMPTLLLRLHRKLDSLLLHLAFGGVMYQQHVLGNSTECAILLAGFASVIRVFVTPMTAWQPALQIQKLCLFDSTTCINAKLISNTDSAGGVLTAVGR